MRTPLIRLCGVALLAFALQAPGLAQAAEYNPRRSGHPVRIVAYALHPVGYLLDRLIFYPAWLIGQWEPVGALVGMKRTVRDIDVEPQAARKGFRSHPNVLIEIGPALPPETRPRRSDEPESPSEPRPE